MCPQITRKNVNHLVNHSYPTYHEGKTCYVDFVQYDPVLNKMRRKKYHLDKIKTKREKRQRAAVIISVLNERFKSGWNVWTDKVATMDYTEIAVALTRYEKHILAVNNITTLRNKTAYGYLSYLGIFKKWLEGRALSLCYCSQMTVTLFSDFLEYILERGSTARTRNNYRTWLSTLCQWMVEKSYLTENPIEKIKTLKEDAKRRDALSAEDLAKLYKYLNEENKHYLLACLMEYYTFVRPGELSKVKVGDIYIKEMKLFIPAVNSKNRHDGMVALNEDLLRLMIDLGTFDYPSEYYLFGKDFTPCEKNADSRIFRDYFVKVRKALKWGDSKQFYSLKDSGIRDLANAEGIVVARDQARHSDITTTNKYLKQDTLTVHSEVKRFKGHFSED